MSTWTGLLDGKPAGAVGAGDGETLGAAGMVMDGPEGSPVTLGPVPAPMKLLVGSRAPGQAQRRREHERDQPSSPHRRAVR